MKLEEIINDNKQNLTSTDMAIWKYILNHNDKMRKISIHELAKECCVSSTTIVRFAQKLGFDGFGDLKSSLKREEPLEKVHSNDILTALEKFYSKTWSHLMRRNYDNASRLIHEANRVFAFASGYVQSNVVQEIKRLFSSGERLAALKKTTPSFLFTLHFKDIIFKLVLILPIAKRVSNMALLR